MIGVGGGVLATAPPPQLFQGTPDGPFRIGGGK